MGFWQDSALEAQHGWAIHTARGRPREGPSVAYAMPSSVRWEPDPQGCLLFQASQRPFGLSQMDECQETHLRTDGPGKEKATENHEFNQSHHKVWSPLVSTHMDLFGGPSQFQEGRQRLVIDPQPGGICVEATNWVHLLHLQAKGATANFRKLGSLMNQNGLSSNALYSTALSRLHCHQKS